MQISRYIRTEFLHKEYIMLGEEANKEGQKENRERKLIGFQRAVREMKRIISANYNHYI